MVNQKQMKGLKVQRTTLMAQSEFTVDALLYEKQAGDWAGGHYVELTKMLKDITASLVNIDTVITNTLTLREIKRSKN